MLPLKRLVIFVVVATAIYGILVVPKTPLMDGYRALMRAISSAAFYKLGNGGSAYLEKLSDAQHDKDTTVRLINRTQRKSGAYDMKLLFRGYRPTCFFVALVIATPVPWKRRMWALFAGLVLITAFVVIRIWLQVVDVMSNNDVLRVYELGRSSKGIVQFLVKEISLNPVTGYVVPALIWVLVTLRTGDLVRLMDLNAATPKKNDGDAALAAHAR